MLLAMTGVALYPNLQSYLVKLLIDAIASPTHTPLISFVFYYAVMQICLMFIWVFYDLCIIKINPIRCDITNLMLDKIKQYDATFFQNYLGGSLSSKIKDASTLIPSLIFLAIDNYFHLSLMILIGALALFSVHWFFSLALVIWVALFLMINTIKMPAMNHLSTQTAEADSKIWGRLVDYLSNFLSIKYFASNQHEISTLKNLQGDYNDRVYTKGIYFLKSYRVLGLAFSIYIVSCLIALIYFHNQNLITPGDFAFVFAINHRIVDQLFILTHTFREFVTNWGTVTQALKILDLPIEIQDKPDAKPIVIKKGEITFDSVQFHYKGTEPLFERTSILIKAGQKVGLVGYSGGGKSTFANLILRLFDVTGGRILIDEQNIKEVTQDSLRSQIAMIPQDPSLFHRTLMENIRYGRINARDEEVIKASEKAYAHAFISKLPNGYNALVGERGVKLSGGQRQRIAIARAILKNAPILILDEATSQLDSVTEIDIQESLWELMQGKTTLVIAHRLSTLLHMDRILVFDQGKIVEDGTHTELLGLDGLYKTLWDAQIGGFLPEEKG